MLNIITTVIFFHSLNSITIDQLSETELQQMIDEIDSRLDSVILADKNDAFVDLYIKELNIERSVLVSARNNFHSQ